MTVLSGRPQGQHLGRLRRPNEGPRDSELRRYGWITPAPHENSYRQQYGLSGKFVVMYAGNVGLSQSLDLVLDAAAALAHERDIVFVINGGGAGRASLEQRAKGMTNVVFIDMQPSERLPEVIAAADSISFR